MSHISFQYILTTGISYSWLKNHFVGSINTSFISLRIYSKNTLNLFFFLPYDFGEQNINVVIIEKTLLNIYMCECV